MSDCQENIVSYKELYDNRTIYNRMVYEALKCHTEYEYAEYILEEVLKNNDASSPIVQIMMETVQQKKIEHDTAIYNRRDQMDLLYNLQNRYNASKDSKITSNTSKKSSHESSQE